MVWLGVGTALAVVGCFIYYTRTVNSRREAAVQSAVKEHVFKSTKQVQETSQGRSSTFEAAAANERVSRRPTSTPSLSLPPLGAVPDDKRAQPAQKPQQEGGIGVGRAKPAPTTAPSREPPRLKPPTFSSMPPPPRPTNGTALRPPPSAASMLRVPPTKVLSNSSMAPSSLMPLSKPSRKVVLAPGHSTLDWAMLTSNPTHKLRGKDVPDNFIRVSPSMLKHHNGRKGRDAWTEYQGKVYNITPYLPFHPGGEAELMKGAGRDAAKLFMEVHPWVNWDGMLAECLVGILVAEGDEGEKPGIDASKLDEMD